MTLLGKQKMSNCKPMSLYPIICQYIKILFGTKNCHCNLIVILCLTVGLYLNIFVSTKRGVRNPNPPLQPPFSFPSRARCWWGRSTATRRAGTPNVSRSSIYSSNEPLVFDYSNISYENKYSRSGLVQISKSF